MDHGPGVSAAVLGTVALLAAATLAGCGAQPSRAARPQGPQSRVMVAHPPVPGLTPRPGPPWRIDPDQPVPRRGPWRPVLAVARRFANADMSYQVGEVGPSVRSAITATCTEAFAAELLSHRATLPPGYQASEVRQRLVAVAPLDRLPDGAVVLATVRSTADGDGALELRLVPRPGGWRVAGLSVV
jgi:hypothetical protein